MEWNKGRKIFVRYLLCSPFLCEVWVSEQTREREQSERKQPRGKLHSIVLRMNRGRKEPERTRGLFSERLGSGVVNENLWYNEEVWELRRKGKCWGSE